MSVVHLRFDEPQSSFVCTCCGKFPVVDAAIAQDAVDRHLSLYCEDCAENIGPREVVGARTATNSASPKLPEWERLWNNYVSEYMSTHGMKLPDAGVREIHLGFYEHLVRQLSGE